MTQTSAWDKFMLLSWKNWLMQFRHPLQTTLEIMIPVLVCAFLILIRALVDVTVVEKPLLFTSINMEFIDDASFDEMTRGMLSNFSNSVIAYSPMNPHLNSAMERTAGAINFELRGFANSQALEANALSFRPFVSIEFDDNLSGTMDLPKNVHYAVRFPGELRRNDGRPDNLAGFSNNWSTNIRFGIDFIPGPRNNASNDGGQPPGYIRVGFSFKLKL